MRLPTNPLTTPPKLVPSGGEIRGSYSGRAQSTSISNSRVVSASQETWEAKLEVTVCTTHNEMPHHFPTVVALFFTALPVKSNVVAVIASNALDGLRLSYCCWCLCGGICCCSRHELFLIPLRAVTGFPLLAAAITELIAAAACYIKTMVR